MAMVESIGRSGRTFRKAFWLLLLGPALFPVAASARTDAPARSPAVGAWTCWFFQPSNVELVVKVLDGRAVNGRFWVFYGALSNVEYTITVTDTVTGAVKTYFNPQGNLASVADTEAF